MLLMVLWSAASAMAAEASASREHRAVAPTAVTSSLARRLKATGRAQVTFERTAWDPVMQRADRVRVSEDLDHR